MPLFCASVSLSVTLDVSNIQSPNGFLLNILHCLSFFVKSGCQFHQDVYEPVLHPLSLTPSQKHIYYTQTIWVGGSIYYVASCINVRCVYVCVQIKISQCIVRCWEAGTLNCLHLFTYFFEAALTGFYTLSYSIQQCDHYPTYRLHFCPKNHGWNELVFILLQWYTLIVPISMWEALRN